MNFIHLARKEAASIHILCLENRHAHDARAVEAIVDETIKRRVVEIVDF